MKTLKIISALLIMGSMAIAKPNPNLKRQDKNVKVEVTNPLEKSKLSKRDSKKREHFASHEGAKVAKKKAKYNQMRYRHEAKERRNFNEKRNSSKV
ncbi:MAG: hypothetical protein H7329_03655 [Opitutaceae bacterium]|nr:hypothetical protein [Cytophagales bacterium]